MLHDDSVNSLQRTSIVTTAARSSTGFKTPSSIKKYVAVIQYEKVKSALRQREKTCSSYENTVMQEPACVARAITATNREESNDRISGERGSGRLLVPCCICWKHKLIQRTKNSSMCSRCEQYGRWYGDYEEDGKLKNRVIYTLRLISMGGNKDELGRPNCTLRRANRNERYEEK